MFSSQAWLTLQNYNLLATKRPLWMRAGYSAEWRDADKIFLCFAFYIYIYIIFTRFQVSH
jgi:hypothetical protein